MLGLLLGEGERLHVCDRFVPPSAEDEDFLEGTLEFYRPYGRDKFEQHYLRFHEELPTVHECSSAELHGKLKPDSYRLIHVDGSHRREIVQSDLQLARELLVDGGIVVVSSYRTMATFEVAAAFWRHVAEGLLFPLCASESKVYATTTRSSLDPDDVVARLKRTESRSVATPPFGNNRLPLVKSAGQGRFPGVKRYVPQALWPLAGRITGTMDTIGRRIRGRSKTK